MKNLLLRYLKEHVLKNKYTRATTQFLVQVEVELYWFIMRIYLSG